MMFFSRSHKKEMSALIVFIESGAVHIGVALSQPDEAPMLVYETVRRFKAGGSPEQLIAGMLSALTSACDDVTKDALPHIISRRTARGAFDSVKFVYGAPWYISRGRSITIENGSPKSYSAKALETLIEEHGADIIPELNKDAVLIERSITAWKINGYAVSDPVGKEGVRISLTIYASAMPAGVKNAVEEAVARSFHARTISHHSIVVAASQALNQRAGDTRQTLLIHLSDLTTELGLISNSTVLDSMTFPEGAEHIRRSWSERTGRLIHESRLRDQRSPKDITLTDSWKAGVSGCLSALIAGSAVPQEVKLLVDPGLEAQCIEAVREIISELFGQSIAIASVATTNSTSDTSILRLLASIG